VSAPPAELRERVPLLGERVYCATQCLGPCLRETFEALDAYRRTLTRRARDLDAWIERYEATHQALERLLGAPPGSVFLAATATAAQAAIASSLHPRAAADRVVIGAADFHSSRYLWRAQRARGFEVVEVEAEAHAATSRFVDAIDERTAVVALSLVSPRSGALLGAERVAARCREVGAVFVLDAYQAVGVVPVDVGRIGAHVVVGGTHKWLHGAGTGLAFAYVEPALAARLTPAYPGWLAAEELLGDGDRFVPREGARRFAQGTPPVEALYTAAPGIALALEVGVASLRAQSELLTARLVDGAVERGWSLSTPRDPARRGGMVCLALDDAERVVAALERDGVDVDSRPGAGVRIGPHPFQTEAEMDRVLEALDRAMAT